MSTITDDMESAVQSSVQTEHDVHAGCVMPSTVLSAANAVSVGLSTVLQHMSDFTAGVGVNADEMPNRGNSSRRGDTDSRMKGYSSVRNREERSVFDEKKTDQVTAETRGSTKGPNAPENEGAPMAVAPTGILYNSSPARPKSKKVVRITPPRSEKSDESTEPSRASPSNLEGRSTLARMRFEFVERSSEGGKRPSRPSPKSPEEFKAEKQRKWRSKMKIAQEQQKQEKLLLGSKLKSRRRRSSSKGSQGVVSSLGERFLDFIESCGDVDGFVSDSDESRPDESSTSSDGSRKTEKSKQSQQSAPSRIADDATNVSVVSVQVGQSLFDPGQNIVFDYSEVSQQGKSQASPQLSEFLNASSALSSKMMEKSHVRTFVQDMVDIGIPFFWQKEVMAKKPKAVVLRLKPSLQTPEGSFCSPRMTWQLDEFEAYGINLFDIQFLGRATHDQLKDYPMAVPSRTVFVSMNRGQEFVFEATSEDEAVRFVVGMKLLVARLSFNLVIGNVNMVFDIFDAKESDDVNMSIAIGESRSLTAMDDLAQELLFRSFPA